MTQYIGGCDNGIVAASLQDQLDRITQNTRKLVQADRLAVSELAIAELFNTGIEDRILPMGSIAPGFSLQDTRTGKPIHSADLLTLGPLVVKFFRGRWCPYCVTELETWRGLYPELRERGALFVAISPQTPRQNDFMIQQHALPFPLLADPSAAVAEKFGIAYTIPEPHRRYYQSILINIPFNNAGLSYHNARKQAGGCPCLRSLLSGKTGQWLSVKRTLTSAFVPSLRMCSRLSKPHLSDDKAAAKMGTRFCSNYLFLRYL